MRNFFNQVMTPQLGQQARNSSPLPMSQLVVIGGVKEVLHKLSITKTSQQMLAAQQESKQLTSLQGQGIEFGNVPPLKLMRLTQAVECRNGSFALSREVTQCLQIST